MTGRRCGISHATWRSKKCPAIAETGPAGDLRWAGRSQWEIIAGLCGTAESGVARARLEVTLVGGDGPPVRVEPRDLAVQEDMALLPTLGRSRPGVVTQRHGACRTQGCGGRNHPSRPAEVLGRPQRTNPCCCTSTTRHYDQSKRMNRLGIRSKAEVRPGEYGPPLPSRSRA